ncbi:MAG: hypothetical protein M0Z61_04550 [Nitrospiraceae bacterium]|nr:hypothetical protein [Nitrospiraceae bacterium]
MMPGLGKKYGIDIETISKPLDDYHTDEYYASGLPIAPSIIVNGETAVTGDITGERLEAIICQHLGIDPPNVKKSLLNFFGGGK